MKRVSKKETMTLAERKAAYRESRMNRWAAEWRNLRHAGDENAVLSHDETRMIEACVTSQYGAETLFGFESVTVGEDAKTFAKVNVNPFEALRAKLGIAPESVPTVKPDRQVYGKTLIA